MSRRRASEAGPVGLVTGLGHRSLRLARLAEQQHPPLGEILNVDGTAVHYMRQGSGPVVILLHGAGGNLRDMTFQLATKMAKTNTVITFDRPGHGYTDILAPKGESPGQQAALLHRACARIGVRQAVICGYSLDGAVALAWGLAEPEFTQGLLLISAVSHPWPGSIGWLYKSAAHPLTSAFVVPFLAAFTPESLVQSTLKSVFQPKGAPEGYLDYVGAGLSLRPHCLRANARQVARLKGDVTEMARNYHKLAMPVEILHGDQDRAVYAEIHAEKLAATLPQARYTELAGIGHSPHHHSHAAVLAALGRLNALRAA